MIFSLLRVIAHRCRHPLDVHIAYISLVTCHVSLFISNIYFILYKPSCSVFIYIILFSTASTQSFEPGCRKVRGRGRGASRRCGSVAVAALLAVCCTVFPAPTLSSQTILQLVSIFRKSLSKSDF